MQREHFVNPVLDLEYEQSSGADKILKKIDGRDVEADQDVPNATARRERDRELGAQLRLSKSFKGWNWAENTIAAKNLTGGNLLGVWLRDLEPAILWA